MWYNSQLHFQLTKFMFRTMQGLMIFYFRLRSEKWEGPSILFYLLAARERERVSLSWVPPVSTSSELTVRMIIKWVLGNYHQHRDHSFPCVFVVCTDTGQRICLAGLVFLSSTLLYLNSVWLSQDLIIINIIIISDVSDASDASCVLRRRRRSEETGGLQCLQSSVAPGLAQSLPGREHRETWLVWAGTQPRLQLTQLCFVFLTFIKKIVLGLQLATNQSPPARLCSECWEELERGSWDPLL